MQTIRCSSADVGKSRLTSQDSPVSPEATRRFLFYLVLAVAAGLAALEIELSNSLEEAAQSETQPRPTPTSERSQS
jgi:hypothetical protein